MSRCEEWFVGSGATSHLSCIGRAMEVYVQYETPLNTGLGGNQTVQAVQWLMVAKHGPEDWSGEQKVRSFTTRSKHGM